MRAYDKNKELSYLQCCDVSNLYGCTMPQKLPVNNFEWIKNASQFNKNFVKTIMKKVMKDVFLKMMYNIVKNNMNVITIYHFYQKEIN